MSVTIAESNQFIRHIEGGDHRDTVESHDLAAVADLPHLGIEKLGGIQEVGTLLDRAGDVILLLEYAHADAGLIVAHACSIDFNRPIIASTRARTCSFFCNSPARSAVSVSCRCRSARFSSLIWLTVRMRSSSRFSSRFSSSSTADLALASFIGPQYRARQSAMQRADWGLTAVLLDKLCSRTFDSRILKTCWLRPAVWPMPPRRMARCAAPYARCRLTRCKIGSTRSCPTARPSPMNRRR